MTDEDLQPERRVPRRSERERTAPRGRGRARDAGALRVGRGPGHRASERSTLNPRAPRSNASSSRRGATIGARIAIAAVLVLAIAGGIGYGVWNTLYRPASNVPAGRAVTFTIEPGTSAAEVGERLARAGVVTNATMFRMKANDMGAADDLKPGVYELVTGSAYEDVIAILAEGPQIEYVTFTVPEGWGIDSLAARVEAKFGIPADEFADLAKTGARNFDHAFLKDNPTKSLEGYLFPKTYTLEASATASDIIDVMLAQYGKEIADLDYDFAASKNLTPHDVLTMASIIEREAVLDKDRPKVASVIYNRLRIGMRLQLDATVHYALNGKEKLTLDDLKTNSPYNTYVITGLPPGPICSPGITSIKAAAKPAKTDYIYYILTHKDGSQSFTTSYDEFLRWKAYLKQSGLK